MAGAEGEMFQVEEPCGPQLRAGKRLAFSGTEGRSGGQSVVRGGGRRDTGSGSRWRLKRWRFSPQSPREAARHRLTILPHLSAML